MQDTEFKASSAFLSRGDREVSLSVIVPAFNEELRLPGTLLKAVDYLNKNKANPQIFPYEILVVDDGSSDRTSEVVDSFALLNAEVFWLKLLNNQGKGKAVQVGMLNARGKLALFMDADGASPMEEIERLLKAVHAGADLAFGSRALQQADTKIDTVWYRKCMGRAFNLLVNTLLLPNVLDTQCGFKLFKSECAKQLFSRQTLAGFGFDVEILYLARKLGCKAKEVPINWTNIPGSKVRLIQHSMRMFLELLIIKYRHAKRAQIPS
jgi:dolichyl-phosphate beta-glucosyltransferase